MSDTEKTQSNQPPADSAAAKPAKASAAAQKKADESGVDLATVKGTGAAGGITTDDVERAERLQAAGAVEAEEEDTRHYEARLNPELSPYPDSVRIGDRVYMNGTRITSAEYEELKGVKSGPSVEHPNGLQYVLRGSRLDA